MDLDLFNRTGWPYPVRFSGPDGELEELSYVEDIRESLKILFKTLPGERIAHPLYGCDLTPFMFRPISLQLLEGIRQAVMLAIAQFEARIEVISVEVQTVPHVPYQLNIEIAFRLPTANYRYNLTIPFYTMEKEN